MLEKKAEKRRGEKEEKMMEKKTSREGDQTSSQVLDFGIWTLVLDLDWT